MNLQESYYCQALCVLIVSTAHRNSDSLLCSIVETGEIGDCVGGVGVSKDTAEADGGQERRGEERRGGKPNSAGLTATGIDRHRHRSVAGWVSFPPKGNQKQENGERRGREALAT